MEQTNRMAAGLAVAEDCMKGIIDEQGPKYLTKKPYEVYEKLVSGGTDRACAGLVLVTILAGAVDEALDGAGREELSAAIEKNCFLTKEAADSIAGMYVSLFSGENLEEWENRVEEGLDAFCSREWDYEWDGRETWHSSYGGGQMECTCEISAKLHAVDRDAVWDAVWKLLDDNPYTGAEEIFRYLRDEIDAKLEKELEDYVVVNGDDYYPPVMEDYDCTDVMEECCSDMGLAISGLTCRCYDDGY